MAEKTPTVVIVHAPDDSMPARALAQKLSALGLRPVIDLPPGDALSAALSSAGAVIALWSPRASERADLVDALLEAGAIVHARMQSAPLPAAFMGAQAVDLTGWRGEDDFQPWRTLAAQVAAQAARTSTAGPIPRPANPGFFQPGATTRPPEPMQEPAPGPTYLRATPPVQPVDAPPPASAYRDLEPDVGPYENSGTAAGPLPRDEPPARPTYLEPEPKRGPNLALIAIVTFIAVGAVGGGGYYFWERGQQSASAEAAWDNIDINSASELRAFLDGNPGALRAEAKQALADLEQSQFDAAREADTIEAFDAFLVDFPDSEHALEARGRIAELQVTPAASPAPAIDPVTGLPIDPVTGLPVAPADPDLVPPGALEAPGAAPDTGGGGPVALTPPENPAEEPAPTAPGDLAPTF